MTGDSEGRSSDRVRLEFGWPLAADAKQELLRRYQHAVADPTPAALHFLRSVVRQTAQGMRAAGVLPEHALVSLKEQLQLLRRTASSEAATPSTDDGPPRSEAQIYSELFGWWLTAYFAQPSTMERPLSPKGAGFLRASRSPDTRAASHAAGQGTDYTE